MTSVTFSACKKFVTLKFFSLKKRVSLVAQVKDLCSLSFLLFHYITFRENLVSDQFP